MMKFYMGEERKNKMLEQLQLVMDDNLPLRDAVFITLRDAILKSVLLPGQHLMEMQLAVQLGVSRTPVREAIRKLEIEGLVVMVPRKGARVAAISEKSLSDVLEVRRALEELSVTLACERMTSDQLTQLKSVNEHFRKIIMKEDVVQIAQVDEQFHDIIYQSTHNDRLLGIVHKLQNQMYRYRVEHIKNSAGRKNLPDEHARIIEAIEKRDKQAASEAMNEHIRLQEKCVMSIIHEQVEQEKKNWNARRDDTN